MPDESEPTFEEALTQLEQLVDDLERGEPALSTALAKYEAGVKLLRHCYRLLDQAEQSVALLTGVDARGEPLTAPFDATATLARELNSSPTAADLDPQPKPPAGESLSGAQSDSRDDRSEAPGPRRPGPR